MSPWLELEGNLAGDLKRGIGVSDRPMSTWREKSLVDSKSVRQIRSSRNKSKGKKSGNSNVKGKNVQKITFLMERRPGRCKKRLKNRSTSDRCRVRTPQKAGRVEPRASAVGFTKS